MLTAPVLDLVLYLATTVSGFVDQAAQVLGALPLLVIPWPFEWLPTEPFLFMLAVSGGSAAFAAAVKGVRWLYGLVPFAQ